MIACKEGLVAVVQAIIGIDETTSIFRASDGYTPLMIASENGNIPIITAIKVAIVGYPEIDAYLNSERRSDGATALILACKGGYDGVITALFRGANTPDPDKADKAGNTALIYACQTRGKERIVGTLLLADANANAHNKMDETPLMLASIMGSREIVNLLLRNGAAVNKVRKLDGATAVLLAVFNRHHDIAAELIGHGADINIGTKNTGYTPLMAACEKGSLDMIKRLVGKGANVNAAKKDDGQTPLIIASTRGNTENVNYLLKHGANVNATTNGYRSTALMWASFKGNETTVKALLQYRANPEMKTTNGKTALSFAVLGRRPAIIKILQKKQDLTKETNTRRVASNQRREPARTYGRARAAPRAPTNVFGMLRALAGANNATRRAAERRRRERERERERDRYR
jgi:ankyrin repeat protein